jgi:hypothetical protein
METEVFSLDQQELTGSRYPFGGEAKMKRRRFNWIWLCLGVLVISATCGFGFEARRTRTQFEEAKDAFGKRDWDKVVANLSEEQFNPPAKTYIAFLQRYLDPALDSTKAKLHFEKLPSRYIPIENEFLSYRTPELHDRPLAFLSFRDKVVRVRVPFFNQSFGIFKGKVTGMRFVVIFYRVAAIRHPHTDRRDQWKSVIEFVQRERHRLEELGITPTELNSPSKNWGEFVWERTEIARKAPLAEFQIRVR